MLNKYLSNEECNIKLKRLVWTDDEGLGCKIKSWFCFSMGKDKGIKRRDKTIKVDKIMWVTMEVVVMLQS